MLIGTAKPITTLRGREDGGLDTDQLTTKVDERAARVAGVDGRVSLDEVLVPLLSETPKCHNHFSRGLPPVIE